MSKFGIDISKWQGDFDIAAAKKNEGIEFVILKIGGGDNGLYKDKKFDTNYSKCEACGMPKGVYFFGHALTLDEAKKEATYLISLLANHKFEYPVFYDVEADMLSLNKSALTEIIEYVCNAIEKAGYWSGIYASVSTFNSEVNDDKLSKYSHWVASWSKTKPTLSKGGDTQMWQFGGETNKLRSNKVNGQVVDQDYCYVDYPTLIKKAGLNGYGSEEFEPYKVRVTASTLNVRMGASKSYKIVSTVKKNSVYTIVEEDNGWGKLKSGLGWICLAFTTKV